MTHKRKYTFRPDCEGLEGRQLLSTTITNVGSGKVLDDKGFSTKVGTKLIQYHSNGGINQQWNVIGLGGGLYEIQNAFSHLVLDDPKSSTSKVQIIQYPWHDGRNQKWSIIPLGGHEFEIKNLASGMVLDDLGGSMADGAAIKQNVFNGSPFQQWKLTF